MTHTVGVVPTADPRNRSAAAATVEPWRAECACGWKGGPRRKKRQAAEDAAAHVRAMLRAAGAA